MQIRKFWNMVYSKQSLWVEFWKIHDTWLSYTMIPNSKPADSLVSVPRLHAEQSRFVFG